MLRLALLVLAYVVTGRLGLAIPYVGSDITLVWLPTGIAVAALVRWGWGYWPGIWLGALLVNLSIGSPWPVAAAIALGNTLGPLLAAAILRHLEFHPLFQRQRDIGIFCLAAALGMVVSASGGVASLYLGGLVPAPVVSSAWLCWWLGDTVGVLLAAPVLLTLNRKNRSDFLRRRSELLAWVLVMALVAWEAFILTKGEASHALPLAFLTLPLVVWAALRFGITGASLAVLGLSLIAARGHRHRPRPLHPGRCAPGPHPPLGLHVHLGAHGAPHPLP